jgi:hypothetical protein
MSIDWKAAPKDATHYNEINNMFYKLVGHEFYFYEMDNETLVRGGNKSRYQCVFIERPQPKPWSGPEDGLPPVNTSCQMQDDVGCWVDVLIIANYDSYAHGWQSAEQDCFYSNDPTEFRAASTPEQIRETAIRELMDIAQVDCRVTAARLVDAGFKREVV